MIVYLDQIKWIELSRMMHGKDCSDRAKRIVQEFETAAINHNIFPLSAVHYLETARVANEGRRSRLGETMWHFSQGNTIAAYSIVVCHELEVALSDYFPEIKTSALQLIGRGISHAFNTPPLTGVLSLMAEEVERAFLIGSKEFGVPPPFYKDSEQQNKFREHLRTLNSRKESLPKEKWDDWLHAIIFMDIREPLQEVVLRHKLRNNFIAELGKDGLKGVISKMPSRVLDLHLHKQVLRNSEYSAKITDLEDWSGVGVASCYCDVVVCEKHMADMFRRNGFQTKARIETDLNRTFTQINI